MYKVLPIISFSFLFHSACFYSFLICLWTFGCLVLGHFFTWRTGSVSTETAAFNHAIQATQQRPLQAWTRPHRHVDKKSFAGRGWIQETPRLIFIMDPPPKTKGIKTVWKKTLTCFACSNCVSRFQKFFVTDAMAYLVFFCGGDWYVNYVTFCRSCFVKKILEWPFNLQVFLVR